MTRRRKPPWLPKHPILVIGDFCIDDFTQARASRMSREQPVPVFVSGDDWRRDGCAGNVVRQILALGVPTETIRLSTTTKTRILAGDPPRELFRLDFPWPTREGPPYFWARRVPPSGVVFVDYQGIAPSPNVVDWLTQAEVPLIGDAHRSLYGWEGFDLLKVSEPEVEGIPPEIWISQSMAHAVVVTRGARGHTLANVAGIVDAPAHPSHGPIANVSGAGDVFTATAAVALAGGQTVEEACRLAGIAASLRVMKPEYNATVTWREIWTSS
jgi:D-beta-D-heptose 7-phosphate kinase/D-beta-D-heptose 1-phosphate adenosyltransferase